MFELPDSICYGSVSVGGFVACAMASYVVSYAAQQPRTKDQTDSGESLVNLSRRRVSERHIQARGFSEYNVRRALSYNSVIFHREYISLQRTAVKIANFAILGTTVDTAWRLYPPPRNVDFRMLATHDDPGWTCYYTAFHSNGFRRAYASVKSYIPKEMPHSITFIEQWISPGWDCTPLGSKDSSVSDARWTNKMIQFAVDLNLPVQENFVQPHFGEIPVGSIAATLKFAAMQEEARKAGRLNWRELLDDGSQPEDGSKNFKHSLVHATLTMSTEIKKRLPDEGVRWLYLRSKTRSIQNGRMDLQVLLLDEGMDLVAISHQVAQIIQGIDKNGGQCHDGILNAPARNHTIEYVRQPRNNSVVLSVDDI
ncbi:hypothetical protein BDV95DRAFT_672251 [Massariosphaeria phaeospora]|uniref:Acyl-CoA thioesterase-like C-terminal domain-containing protein n=1 Tax=Massariosphaeria phaeospora TaxID=100035 RepID=A0A7C8I1X8_9PLEO|nr:hypothetical protein BDV95DRAFT_672251 [Massariosphaeria phaeospora]